MLKKQREKSKEKHLLETKNSNAPIVIAFCILFLVIAVIECCIALSPDKENQEQEKQKNVDLISIDLIGSSLVDQSQYNIWFSVNCNETDGTISMKPSVGYVLKMDITDETNVQVVETINYDEVNRYTYIWIVETMDKDFVGYIDVEYENSTTLKTASIYSIFSGETIGFLERDQYQEYEQAIAEKESEEVTE